MTSPGGSRQACTDKGFGDDCRASEIDLERDSPRLLGAGRPHPAEFPQISGYIYLGFGSDSTLSRRSTLLTMAEH